MKGIKHKQATVMIEQLKDGSDLSHEVFQFPQVAELPAGNVGQGALSGCSEVLLYGSSGDAEHKGGAKGCVLS